MFTVTMIKISFTESVCIEKNSVFLNRFEQARSGWKNREVPNKENGEEGLAKGLSKNCFE